MKKNKRSTKRNPAMVINGIKLYADDSREFLLNTENILKALSECLLEGDEEAFHEIFSYHLSLVNKEELSRKSKVPIATIRRMAAGANFNMENYFKVMKVLSKKKIA